MSTYRIFSCITITQDNMKPETLFKKNCSICDSKVNKESFLLEAQSPTQQIKIFLRPLNSKFVWCQTFLRHFLHSIYLLCFMLLLVDIPSLRLPI